MTRLLHSNLHKTLLLSPFSDLNKKGDLLKGKKEETQLTMEGKIAFVGTRPY